MQEITVNDLQARLQAGEKIHLLDVREPAEHAEFNIGGTLIPLGQIQTMQLDDIEAWRTEEVICYCRSGKRSFMAAMILEQCGFTNVKNLTGGVLAWQAQ